jgi:hypothetical protein
MLEPRREVEPLARTAFGLGALSVALLLCAAGFFPRSLDLFVASHTIQLGLAHWTIIGLVAVTGLLAPGIAAMALGTSIQALFRIRRQENVRGVGWAIAAITLALLPLEASVEAMYAAWNALGQLL